MRTKLTLFSAAILLLLAPHAARGQYFVTGQDPAATKWLVSESANGRLVYPADYSTQAMRMMGVIDSTRRWADYGFAKGPMGLPIALHTRNASSNGLVMLAPNRMELISSPPAHTYATPWHKQLISHEMRHAVQYNNLNSGAIRVLGKIFGQHGSALGMAFMPLWAMEGDAVHAETQMSAFGRALQPSFTIDLRAMLLEGGAEDYPVDKFFSGSYVDNIPSHYHIGYQVTAYAWEKYGENVWNKTVNYGARRPYQLFTTHIALKKYYSTKTTKLLRETMSELAEYWRSQPLVDNSATIINTPVTSFTTYSTPVESGSGTIYALKSDFDRSSRIVRVDPGTGEETVLHRTGVVNTGLTLVEDGDGLKLWWTELRQSTFWGQKVNSVLCWYDVPTGKSGTLRTEGNATFPTPMLNGHIAWLEYLPDGHYEIVCSAMRDGRTVVGDARLALPDTITVHGLAYDGYGGFWIIALDDSRMWLGRVTRSPEGDAEVTVGTPPSYVTLSNLRHAGGKLYYNSIASGKDEAYVLDPSSGRQYQLTESRYGSFDPSPTSGGSLLVTTYTPQGYLLARQTCDGWRSETPHSTLPLDVVNPVRTSWDVPSVDDIPTETAEVEAKRYRKGLHMFGVHSWAPVWYEPDNLLGETNLNVHVGVSLLMQNLLGSVYGTVGYKYTEEGSFGTASLRFHGWAPKFEIEAEYGTADQLVYAPRDVIRQGLLANVPIDRGNYFEITARAYLPITLGTGYHVRRLTPMVELEHINAKMFHLDYLEKGDDWRAFGGHFRHGMQKLKASLMYTDNVRLAHRDFLPRWGYALRATYTGNPFDPQFGSLISGFGRLYLPGIGAHHSLMLRGAFQYADLGTYNFRQKELLPRGARFDFTPERYGAAAVDYQFPVWHPDGGINSLLYFKRIRLNLCYDYARYRSSGRWSDIHSFGADVVVDFIPVRLPAASNTSFTVGLHKSSDRNAPVVKAGFMIAL